MRRVLSTLVFTTSLLAAPWVFAADAPTKADTAEAKLRFDEGIKLAEASDHEAARLKFNQAWALLKSPGILFNLARSEQLSNHLVEAYEHYRQFSKWPADPKVTDAQRARATENMAALAKKIGSVDVEASPTARISVDGRPVEMTGEVVPVEPGKHVFEAREGKFTKSLTIDIVAGAVMKAKLTFDSSQTTVTTLPAEAPPSPPPSKAPVQEETGFWSTGRIVGAGVLGVGLAGIAVGIVFQVGVGQAQDNAAKARVALPEPKGSACTDPAVAEANSVACGNLSKAVDQEHSRGTLRTGFLIGGGALVVGGAVLFIVSGPKTREVPAGTGFYRDLRVAPILSARENGLVFSGRF